MPFTGQLRASEMVGMETTHPISPYILSKPRNQKRRRVGWRAFVRNLFGFARWVVSGFGLWGLLFGSGAKKGEEVAVYTVHPAFNLWPLIVLGFSGDWFIRHGFGVPTLWGWIYLWTLIATLVTLLFELSLARLLFWLLILAFLWLGLRYMQDLKQIPLLRSILMYFENLHPKYDPGLTRGISTLLVPAWVGAMVHSFLEGKKTFSPNSIEERYVGHGCEVLDRSGLKFRASYRNLLQTLLGFGAADLEAMNGDGVVVKRYRNILFLAFTWRKLDEILHQRAAVVDNAPDDPVEVEEVNR